MFLTNRQNLLLVVSDVASIGGRLRNAYTTLTRNLTERDRFGEDIDIDGKMKFKMGIKYIPCG
jgi:hypothetical protein